MKILPDSSFCNKCLFKSYLFTKLSDEELKHISGYKKEIIFEKGEEIIRENDTINEFLYLKQGLVKLCLKGEHQKERIVSIARPLDFVSLISTFSRSKYQYSIIALEKSVVCSIELSCMKDIIRENGSFALELIENISASSNKVILSTYDIDDKQLRGRIAYILIWFSEKIYEKRIFDLPISRKEIGELINMTTENVIRILSEFNKDGIIRIDGKTIEILNFDLLEKLNKAG